MPLPAITIQVGKQYKTKDFGVVTVQATGLPRRPENASWPDSDPYKNDGVQVAELTNGALVPAYQFLAEWDSTRQAAQDAAQTALNARMAMVAKQLEAGGFTLVTGRVLPNGDVTFTGKIPTGDPLPVEAAESTIPA